MFDLDGAISEWRQQMAVSGIKSSNVLDELEGHLRADIGTLVSAGMPEAQAFRLALSHLGDVRTVGYEFKKLGNVSATPLKIGTLLWMSFSTLLATGLLTGALPGKPSLLLMGHTFCLTAGYIATFLTGGFGIYYVCCRWVRALSLTRQQALSRAVLSFGQLSVGLVLIGLWLGLFWSGRNNGAYFTGGARELGTICASIWLVAFWLVQRFGDVPTPMRMLLCIVGNMVVTLAWFGAGIVAHGHGLGGYWLVEAWLGVHLVLFAIGAMPIFETAEA